MNRAQFVRWARARADARARRPAAPRVPRAIPPDRIVEQYTRALLRLVDRLRVVWAPVIHAIRVLEETPKTDRFDADGSQLRKIRALIWQAVRQGQNAISTSEVDALARKFAAQTSTYQRVQLNRQVHSALTVDPIGKDQGLRMLVDRFAKENVALVKSIPERLHAELESIVTGSIADGRLVGGAVGVKNRPGTLSRVIESRFGVSRERAKVIARDQTLKFYGAVNHARQQEMGIKKFIWRTVRDERVRGNPQGKYPDADPSHFDLEGLTFRYDDPPPAGPNDEPCLPGQAIQCRCYAEPVWDDILDDDEESDQGDDENEN